MYDSISSQILKLDCQNQVYRMGLIGQGKFGKVYQGYDKTNSRIVALKYVNNNKEETWKKEKRALEMFNHPNIIKFYYCIPEKQPNSQQIKGVYFVTQFIRGKNLRQFIQSACKVGEKGLSQNIVLKFFRQLLDGYNHIHGEQFVHRDIKPENILIDQDQNVKIIDFGQTKERKLERTAGLGTPLYAAPETFQGKNSTDFKRDVWSLGLVLYQMIIGKCYFQNWKQCNNQQQFIKFLLSHKVMIKYPVHFDPFWTEITKQMLQKDYRIRKNLHQIKFKLEQKLPELQKIIIQNSSQKIVPRIIDIKQNIGNTNPLTQTQNQFEFSRTKKYLKFFYQKHRFLILVGQLLSTYSYPFISNAHKLIVVFVCLNIYISAIDNFLRRLSDNKIIISQNQKFDVQYFEQPYKTSMAVYLKNYRQYYQKQSRLTKRIIIQKILPKFHISHTQKSSQQSEQVNILRNVKFPHPSELIQQQQYASVKELVQKFNQEGAKIQSKRYYIIFSVEFHHSESDIKKYFYEEDMIVYYLFLVVCNLDEVFNWRFEYLGNQIPKLREQFKSMKRSKQEIQKLLLKISKFNSFQEQ